MFYPHFDVVRVEWQHDGPWLLVDLGQPSDTIEPDGQYHEAWAIHPFAIWKTTGSVYGMNEHGAVNDEPLLSL
jgi:hypothetical protein